MKFDGEVNKKGKPTRLPNVIFPPSKGSWNTAVQTPANAKKTERENDKGGKSCKRRHNMYYNRALCRREYSRKDLNREGQNRFERVKKRTVRTVPCRSGAYDRCDANDTVIHTDRLCQWDYRQMTLYVPYVHTGIIYMYRYKYPHLMRRRRMAWEQTREEQRDW